MSIIDLNIADIFNAIGGGSPLSIIDSALNPVYAIRKHGSSEVALEFSGMASLQPNGRAQITNAPVEDGQYQSINKVKEPSRVRCEIIIKGLTGFTGSVPNIFDLTFTSQNSTLNTIKTMLSGHDIYDIETPKETLPSYDLVGHSYDVNSKRGVTLLTIFLEFQEVMQQMEVVLSGAQSEKQPTDDKKNNGITGAGAPVKDAGATPSTVDSLSKSWSSLKTSLSNVTLRNVTETITTGFQSAMDTVSKPIFEVADSATQKADELVKNISGNVTGAGGK